MIARVIKILSQNYTVKVDNNCYSAVPRGSIKQFGKILVGDIVDIEPNQFGSDYVITKVHPRANSLVRPPVANLDQLVIVMSLRPAPDFELIDKLFIFCAQQGIHPILVINKCDAFDADKVLPIMRAYKYCTDNIIAVSALNSTNLDSLKALLRGKLSAFAGQSAVGKSTLINALSSANLASTQGLSRRSDRGKHTTRHTEIYTIDGDILIADTAGFSMLELDNIKYSDLHQFYPDFASSDPCAYSGCTHINCSANDCAIVADVQAGVIDRGRYNRYVKLYNQLKEKWRNMYD